MEEALDISAKTVGKRGSRAREGSRMAVGMWLDLGSSVGTICSAMMFRPGQFPYLGDQMTRTVRSPFVMAAFGILFAACGSSGGGGTGGSGGSAGIVGTGTGGSGGSAGIVGTGSAGHTGSAGTGGSTDGGDCTTICAKAAACCLAVAALQDAGVAGCAAYDDACATLGSTATQTCQTVISQFAGTAAAPAACK
jgi:hypothetical protein